LSGQVERAREGIIRIISARGAEPYERRQYQRITRKKATSAKTDWTRFDAMTDAQRHQAALSDPDARPPTEDDFRRMKRAPRAKIIRRALGQSQEDFAARYHIPIGTLRDWEQGRVEPDQAARADRTVIASDPEAVSKALNSPPSRGSRRRTSPLGGRAG
jgi:putative transcriptional regulator